MEINRKLREVFRIKRKDLIRAIRDMGLWAPKSRRSVIDLFTLLILNGSHLIGENTELPWFQDRTEGPSLAWSIRTINSFHL